VRGDQPRQLCLEPIDLAVKAAQTRDLVAGDPHARVGGQLAQPAVDAVEHPRPIERAALERALELRAQLEQMPPQPIDRPGPLGDEIIAVIEQKADLHRPLVQKRDREPLDAVLDDRPGDRERVDLVGLARLALALA
jgi:hypothetical protein